MRYRLKTLPSKRNRVPKLASQMWVAVKIDWKTRSSSPGDELDHAKHLGCSRLLLERLVQFAGQPSNVTFLARG